jgi:cytochrome c553
MKLEAGAHGIFFSSNLTPDIETGLGEWTEEEIAAAIQTGHTRARRLNYWAMPWQIYGALAPADALAIAAFLKSLPAIHNAIPEPVYFGSLETVVRKLSYPLPAMPPARLVFGGNASDSVRAHASTQTWLLRGQRGLLLLAVCAWLFDRRKRARPTHGGASTTVALAFVLGTAAVAFVDRYPALGPPAPSVWAFMQAIPAPLGDDHTRLERERGRYLFAISSCAFCHGSTGSGGNKVNWQGFGTTWSANLTPHATGLASWSDDDILRALRSGVRRDGRQMHWRAMTWDFSSNYREEDLRSLVAYIRGLPPVDRGLPETVAPAPADCANYTYWIGDGNDQIGCD